MACYLTSNKLRHLRGHGLTDNFVSCLRPPWPRPATSRHGGKLVNKVHSISTNRVDYEQAVAWGEQWLVSHAFTGL